MKKDYAVPHILTEKCFETSALKCAKYPDTAPPGSWHFSTAYDTFSGHLGSGFGASESVSGSAGVGLGPGGTSGSYSYSMLCGNWVTFTS